MTFSQTIFKENLFKHKVALVTGGGTGIGFEVATFLCSLGCQVIICSRKLNVLEQSCRKLKELFGSQACFAIQCNIRDRESISLCIDQAIEVCGRIDFLINNAGGQYMAPPERIKEKGWNAVIDTNLSGTFRVSQIVFEQVFKKQKHGVIVNVIANYFNGMPLMSHTGAARAGVDNLTISLAQSWARYGVRINSVAPGFIKSSGLDTYPKAIKILMKTHTKHNYTYREGICSEVAHAICFLLSPGSSFITGTCLRVDGGESIYNAIKKPQNHNNLKTDQELLKSPSSKL